MSTYLLNNLKACRLEKGWSQSTLSKMSGLSLRTIQRVESGSPASLETANSLAATFDLKSITPLVGADPLKEQKATGDNRAPFVFFESPHVHEHPIKEVAFFLFFLGVLSFFQQEILLALEPLKLSMFFHTETAPSVTWSLFVAGILLLASLWIITSKPPSRGSKSYYEKKPVLRFPFIHTPLSISHKDYYLNYPLNDRNIPIGTVHVDSTFNRERLISHYRHSISRGVLMIGEEGSGLHVAALGQYFELLCLQCSGLFMLERERSSLLSLIRDVLTAIDRQNDLIEIDVEDLANKDRSWWREAFQQQRLVFCITRDDAATENEKVREQFFRATFENKADFHERQTFPMLVLDDTHIGEPKTFRKQLSTGLQSGLRSILLVKTPDTFTQGDTRALATYFEHKHLMKMHDPKVIRDVFDLLSIDSYEELSVSNILSHAPGESSYLHHHLVWPKMRLRYLYQKTLPYRKQPPKKENGANARLLALLKHYCKSALVFVSRIRSH